MKTYIAAKLHGLRITECNVDYHGSITLDPDWMEEAGIDPYEQVHVLNCTNGQRLVTYAIPGNRGEKEVGLNGAAALLCKVQDRILVLTYRMSEQFPGAQVLTFNDDNEIAERLRYGET